VHDPGRQHRAKREISLGCGYEEREREKEKESRERERHGRSVVFVMG
jgi:hypothetical protein